MTDRSSIPSTASRAVSRTPSRAAVRPPVHRRRRRTIALPGAAAAAIAITAAGCSAPPPTQATDSGTVIQVVAAESVWGEVAAQIGGPQVHVTDLVGGSAGSAGSADPQKFQPSPADTKAIAGAQVFILNGAGLDPWANQAAAADPGVGRLDINVGNNVGVTPGQDPYLWFDSDYVNAAVQQIEQDLDQLRPSSAAYFGEQVAAFEQSAAATDEALAAIIKQQFKGKAIGTCPGMARQVATVLSLKPVAATPAQVGAKQIKALLCDSGAADPEGKALLQAAATAKIPVVQLSPTLSPAGTTFQAWLTAQLNEIDQALTRA
jgi:zinc/manganese transport system substrate-binding protein